MINKGPPVIKKGNPFYKKGAHIYKKGFPIYKKGALSYKKRAPIYKKEATNIAHIPKFLILLEIPPLRALASNPKCLRPWVLLLPFQLFTDSGNI